MPLNNVGDDECWEHDEDLDEAGESRVNILLDSSAAIERTVMLQLLSEYYMH